MAFCQLTKPSAANPTYIIGVEPPALTKGQNFGSCSQLHRRLTTYLEQRMVFNLTPTYTFVDLHIDYGMDGISAPMGDCVKLGEVNTLEVDSMLLDIRLEEWVDMALDTKSENTC